MSQEDAKSAGGDEGQYTRRHALWSALSGSLAFSQLAETRGNQRENAVKNSLPRLLTPAADTAIARGLSWLADRQKEDGGFGADRSYARNVGVCALCGLAFLAQGMRGTMQRHIKGCTDYLLAHVQPHGFIVEEHVVTHAPLYGHGFATTWLAQVYGVDTRKELRSVLKKAVSLIVGMQDESGAWRYTPSPEDADVSVTTCLMLALCSARQAGLAIPRDTILRSVEFLRRCQNPDGGFRYRLIDPPDSLFPRSAAAVAALHAAGLRGDTALTRGREYLVKNSSTLTAPSTDAAHVAEYYFYGRYYATHAAWQARGETWDRWFPTVREELLQRQTSAGHWDDSNIGAEYATAMALLTLQFPFDALPLHLL